MINNFIQALLIEKKRFLLILLTILCTNVYSKEVTLVHDGLTLNANFTQVENWQEKPVLLITHGTLFHNASELITTLQELFSENEISSLAPNLSLGLDNRHHAYDCAIPHTHKHDDAVEAVELLQKHLF